ncbi:hypothetical protein CSPAE12_07461 [Colletotrichum incanum]|nr:hypothetical protein CSPAE12_07461 [Colletotrichum incanum]
MQLFTLTLALVAVPFVMAEPIPADMGANEPLVVRNILMHPRQNLPSCCSVKFRGNCDCGNCPILTCAVGLKFDLLSLVTFTRPTSTVVQFKAFLKSLLTRILEKNGGKGCSC